MSVDPSGEAMLPLDGNAAAGLLSELFAVDVTTAVLTCGGCGAVAALAEAKVYGGMGVVFRCAGCDSSSGRRRGGCCWRGRRCWG